MMPLAEGQGYGFTGIPIIGHKKYTAKARTAIRMRLA
jgi:hypothetical protein